jgi:hypothetical protein
MQKKYLVIGNWTDKTTSKPVSGIAEITDGINKNGQFYAITNTEDREEPVDGTYPIGTILVADVSLSVQKPQSTAK